MKTPFDTLLFKCPKCLWWIAAAKPAASVTKDELHETNFDLKCRAECGWEGQLTGRDAFPVVRKSENRTRN